MNKKIFVLFTLVLITLGFMVQTTSALKKNDQVEIVIEWLNVRADPGTEPGNDPIATLKKSTKGIIIDGPENANDLTWWKINYGTVTGWSAESGDAGTYLTKISTAQIVDIEKGRIVEVVIGGLNVRKSPGSKVNDAFAYVGRGTQGLVIDGPVEADDLIWWKIRYGDSIGWSAEKGRTVTFLQAISKDIENPPCGIAGGGCEYWPCASGKERLPGYECEGALKVCCIFTAPSEDVIQSDSTKFSFGDTVKVTSDFALNVRNGAGLDKDASLAVPKDTVGIILSSDSYDADGTTWWNIEFFLSNGETMNGWSSEEKMIKICGANERCERDEELKRKVSQMIFTSLWSEHGYRRVDIAGIGLNNFWKDESIVKKYDLGGIMLFQEDTKGSLKSTKEYVDALQGFSAFPLFISADVEGGNVNRLRNILETQISSHGAYGIAYNYNSQLGGTLDPEDVVDEVYDTAKDLGSEMKSAGVNTDFAPVLDVVNSFTDDRSLIARTERSFGSDPEIVSKFGTAFINGLKEAGIMSSTKHFPGHGKVQGDTHEGLQVLTIEKDELYRDLLPFKEAIKNDVDMIMIGHFFVNAIDEDNPASLSSKVIEDLLKDELGYTGLVITDDITMEALGEYYKGTDGEHKKRAIDAVKAGADLILESDNARVAGIIDAIVDAVKRNQIPEERINDAYERILTAKSKLKGNYIANTKCSESYGHRLFECTDVTEYHCVDEVIKGLCPGGEEIICCRKGIELSEIEKRLQEIKYNQRPYLYEEEPSATSGEFCSIDVDTGCDSTNTQATYCDIEDANCAGFVRMVFDYIFGPGKGDLIGLYGNAWNVPDNVLYNSGTMIWPPDWPNKGQDPFTDYDSLIPGDLIGMHFTESDYKPGTYYREQYGWERGNTEEIDFTHLLLYLGKKDGKHMVTHLYHYGSADPIRTEPIENFLSHPVHKNQFWIRVIMRPKQDTLYKDVFSDGFAINFEKLKNRMF